MRLPFRTFGVNWVLVGISIVIERYVLVSLIVTSIASWKIGGVHILSRDESALLDVVSALCMGKH